MPQSRWLDDEQQRAWRAFLAVQALLPAALDAQLQRDAGMSHSEYMVLAMLSEAPARTLRMSDLAARTTMSPSRVSHTVSRLEDRGWVSRRPSPDDGRGNLAELTAAGWETVVATAPGHVAAVREHLFDALSPAQVQRLRRAMEAVLRRLEADRP